MCRGSESGKESKSSSDYRNGEGSEDESIRVREDRSESEDPDTFRGRQADVPLDEMLSYDYYEQGGDDHPSVVMHHRLGNNSVAFNSNLKPRPVSADMYQSRKSKALNDDEYGYDDAEYEDDGDGDDPDDADFDPDITSERPNRDDDWEGENINEDINDVDDLDILDEDDEGFRA